MRLPASGCPEPVSTRSKQRHQATGPLVSVPPMGSSMSRLAEAFRKAAADALTAFLIERPVVRDIVDVQETAEVPWDLSESPTGADVVSIPPTSQMRPAQCSAGTQPRTARDIIDIPRGSISARRAPVCAGIDRARPRADPVLGGKFREPVRHRSALPLRRHSPTKRAGRSAWWKRTSAHHHCRRSFAATAQRGLSESSCSKDGDLSNGADQLASNLWLLPCGTRGDDALPGLNAEQLRPRFQELLAMFDYLVVDTAAASDHRDAAVIGPLVDGVVMVSSANATRREVARRTRREPPRSWREGPWRRARRPHLPDSRGHLPQSLALTGSRPIHRIVRHVAAPARFGARKGTKRIIVYGAVGAGEMIVRVAHLPKRLRAAGLRRR